MNLHLWFDVFIEDAPLGVYLRGDRDRFDKDHRIRTAAPAYRFQTKYDISRYSLMSYRHVPWKSAVLRIECQNPAHEAIYDEMRAVFPNGDIQRSRSADAKTYFQAISDSGIPDDDWLFFMPNNDHPFLAKPELLAGVMRDADEAAARLKPGIITIAYSHFTETANFFRPSHHEWGAYGDVYPRLLYETPHAWVIRLDRMLLDSTHIYRAGDLKWIFGSTRKTGRLIRPEDTEFYLTQQRDHVMVVPKHELCRHYDGSKHLLDKVPPLFIPDGFFSSTMRVRYGHDTPREGWIHVNPRADRFSYQAPDGVDLKNVLEDLPAFWDGRIAELDVNPAFPKQLDRRTLPYYQDLENPWRSSLAIRNLVRSWRRYLRHRWKSRRHSG
jgi:hypothetical protein